MSNNNPDNLFWESRRMRLAAGRTPNIAVGILGPRARLRVSVLLNTMPEYRVRYIISKDEIADVVADSDIVLGTGLTACEGILCHKPVVVVGDYGLGGLVTPQTLRNHFDNRFKGKLYGVKDEYFSLERVEEEMKKSEILTFQELEIMSNQVKTFLQNIDF